MEIKKLTCIECPRGCELEVILNDKKIESVSGNFCIKGKLYAENELTRPIRVITSTIRLASGEMLPIKTSSGVLKTEIFTIMEKINSIKAKKPIKIGQVLLKNVDGEGVDIVSAKNID